MNTASSFLSLSVAAALLAACGSDSGSSGAAASTSSTDTASALPTTSMSMMLSDASTEDWATIGVKVLSIALVPQDGGANVTVYSATSPAPFINLAQLDGIADLLGVLSVPVGSYTGAVLTVSGNSSDIVLTVAADPEAGFAAAPGSTISAGQIQVQHTRGVAGSLTVPINVSFATPLAVSAAGSNAIDIEFDLGHPAFIVEHVTTSGAGTIWAVNFDGPVRHHPVHDLRQLVLRHVYGSVTAIASDNSAITITKDLPTLPVVNPETAVDTNQSLQIDADATNGTLLFDLDAQTQRVIKDFSAEFSLTGKYVRIAARYQQDGTLVATRVYASSAFDTVWISPEGHVLHVSPSNDVIDIESESGLGVPITVDADTRFFFRQPESGVADSIPIATGTAFLASNNLTRGFKVHAQVVDPLANPLIAQSVDIETAKYDGRISVASPSGFNITRNFRTTSDDYVTMLHYISSTTPNGTDLSDHPVTGFEYWNFAYPSLMTTGTDAVPDFLAAVSGSVNVGGSIGALPSYGVSYTIWNDPANPNGWAVDATILTPSRLPLGTVETGLANSAFTMKVAGGASAATIDIGSTSGSATLVYQVDRTNNVVSMSSIDVTTSAGLSMLTTQLVAGTAVKVYGVPQTDGTLRAYVLTCFTGDIPSQ